MIPSYESTVQSIQDEIHSVAEKYEKPFQQVLTDLGAPSKVLKAYAAFVEAYHRDKRAAEGDLEAGPSPTLAAFQALTEKQQEDFARLADVAPAHLGPSAPEHAAINQHPLTQDVLEPYICWVARAVDNVLSNLHATTATNYHVLLSPPFTPLPSFPVQFHSETAKSFWETIRGGGPAGLTKFLSLTHPTTTTRRLAMPEGNRSLDVKAKLNLEMRARLREVSGMEEAEMKWTRPATLEGHWGVVLVGWPYVRDEEEEEALPLAERALPMRNPSKNSMVQNKRLVDMLERGELRFIRVSDLTPEQLEHVQQQHIQKRLNPMLNSGSSTSEAIAADLPPASPRRSAQQQSERSKAQRKRVRLVTTLRPPLMPESGEDDVGGADSLVGVGVGVGDDGDALMARGESAELDAAQQIQYSDFVAQLAYLPPPPSGHSAQQPPTSNSRDGAEGFDHDPPSLHALLAASTSMIPEHEHVSEHEHGGDGDEVLVGQKRSREEDEEEDA